MTSTSPLSRSGPGQAERASARPSRRRQRSVRVTVAVSLLAMASLAVVIALPTQSPLWLSTAAVLALVCGWAAARIVYTELAQSRRTHAAERAAQADAYRSMFEERASEHAEFTTAMIDRVKRTDREVADLQVSVVQAQRRAADAESRVLRETRRAQEAGALVVELRDRVEQLEAEAKEAAAPESVEGLATWDGFETVVDLMAWEEKVGAITKAALPPEQKEA